MWVGVGLGSCKLLIVLAYYISLILCLLFDLLLVYADLFAG